MCDEYRICQARTARLVLAEQSDPLFEPASFLMKTLALSTEDLAQEDLLQNYQERVERLSQQNRVIENCADAGFLTTVEVGQYFMTKDSESSHKFTEPVACREYILPRDEKSSDPKGWIRGNTQIGSVLEVTTSYLQGKYGVEIRIESVRISHGLNKLVTDLSNKEDDDNEQETSEMKAETFAFASRSKAEAKPRGCTCICSSAGTVPIRERIWIDIEPGAQFAYRLQVCNTSQSCLSCDVMSCHVMSGQVRSGQVRSGQVRSGRAHALTRIRALDQISDIRRA